ncbi:MAG TPA: Uma2 family endonuclease, partial [Candidatus Hypogeohydataceae bacterium YC41]
MIVNPKIKFTYEEYKHLPLEDTRRYELLGGELVMIPSPLEPHQRVSANLEFILMRYVKEKKLGRIYDAPFDVILSEEDVVQPDIIFISKEHLSIVKKEGIRGAPDLVIEILSPTTADRDKVTKLTLYGKYGVQEYWIVDTNKEEIEIYTLKARRLRLAEKYRSEDILKSPLLE